MSNFGSAGSPRENRLVRGLRRASAGDTIDSLAQLFVDDADEFIFWVDSEARILFGNTAFCRALGYDPEELCALHLWDVSPRTQASWPTRFADLRQVLCQIFVAEFRTRSGGIVPSKITATFANLDGQEYLLCHGREFREHEGITEQLRTEQPREKADRPVRAICIFHDGHFADSALEPLGTSRNQIVQELDNMLQESGTMPHRVAAALRGESVTFDWRRQTPDGSRSHIECTLTRVKIDGAIRLLAVAIDITARRKSEHTVAQLSGRLLQLQDDERRRIARELHDNTGQNLGALSINLSMILATAPKLDPPAREALQESIDLADTCVREIRTLSYLLHPPLLDELGLASALGAYAEGYAERTGIHLDLDLPAPMHRLPQAIEIALFRIVQEGLSNIHRHSGSKTALLRLKHTKEAVELEIIDRGRGMPAGTLESDVASAARIGVGIAGMRERARQLGGHLTIASGETGTTLNVLLPSSILEQ